VKAKSSQVRQRVMKSAAERIFSSGVRGWNMEQLAADSGVTKRTLYKIIPSKEELVERIVMDFISGVQANVSNMIEQGGSNMIAQGGDYIPVLEKIVEAFPSFLDRMHSKAMQEIFLEYPAVEERVYARRAELTAALLAYLETGIDTGHLKGDLDPNVVLELFQAIILYFIRFSSGDEELSRKLAASFRCVLHGIVRE
jgi:AcrR family transcriptional regulator